MKELIWNGRKAHVWLDELPNWTYSVAEIITQSLHPTETYHSKIRRASLELVRARNNSYYGALSALFVPESTDLLEVQICISNSDEQLSHNNLIGSGEAIHIGFPEEYAPGLLEGIIHFEDTRLLGSGTLTFCGALHGEVGSSIHFFQLIGQAIVRILIKDEQSLSDETLKRLIVC